MIDVFGENPLADFKLKSKEGDRSNGDYFICYLNTIEGLKTKCKNLHWAAPKKNIHVYLEEFLEEMNEFQDSIAEGYMGITGRMAPNVITGKPSNALNATDLIEEVLDATLNFYSKLPEEIIYNGIKSELDDFIQNINKYKYLFNLCDVRPY